MIILDMDEPESSSHLDDLTRFRMKGRDESFSSSLDSTIKFAFILGIIVGIILASFLHKYIVHPFGW